MVLENRKYGLVPGKDNFDCIEVSIHTVHSRPVKLKPIFRGISSEWFTIFVSYDFLSEISPPDYVHVNTCNNVQKCIRIITLMKRGILSDPEMALF